ncbi:MAG: OmpA family protein, partial [Ferruginibacter sp.]|nr:OmpA family protein [Cytophagales bacterium]
MKKFVLAAGVFAGALTACEQTSKVPAESTADTAVFKENRPNTDTIVEPISGDWSNVDLVDLPDVKLPEINLPDLRVRGNDNLTAYAVDEKILFDTGKSEIRSGAEAQLQQIGASIGQRYAQGQIRIYGYTDSTATEEVNRELSEERAQAVKRWLVTNANV